MKTNRIFFIADDDPDDQELIIKALRKIDKSSECITAHNGQQAIHKLENEMFFLPDFIFLDLNMPLMNGKQCLVHLKALQKFDGVPVIIYSTSAQNKEVQEMMRLGADCFLQKPNLFDDLYHALNSIVTNNKFNC